MQFTSLLFALFLCVIFYLYWYINDRYRPLLLLAGSYCFYATFSVYSAVLLFLISVTTYLSAGSKKRSIRYIGMILPVVLLCFFKYAHLIPSLKENVVVPVGVSFYFFKALSYMAEVNRGKYPKEERPLYLFLYLSFMPDLLSGPINRADRLIPQFKEKRAFSYEKAVWGLRLILLGLFKKLVIADSLSVYTDRVFASPGSFMGLSSIVAALFYTIQIYCDFSGYSDIAVGVAALFNIDSVRNFRRPYLSENIGDFWNRWHISLSTWLRDYVYIPLGGSKKGKVRTYINLIVTFLVSGIWHGSTLNFVFWGFIHGIYQVIFRLIRGTREGAKKLPKIPGIILSFILATVGWVFFRAENIKDAFIMFRYAFYDLSPMLAYRKLGMNKGSLILVSVSVLILFIYEVTEEKINRDVKADKEILLTEKLDILPEWARFLIYIAVGLCVLLVSLHGSGTQEFIYFKF